MDTSWGGVAKWYHSLLEEDKNSYQKALILPNLLRLLQIKKGERVLDIACGEGFFAREFHKAGAHVSGVDVSKELISIANKLGPKEIQYMVASAEKLPVKDKTFDKALIVLALQNIENANAAILESSRVLKPNGKLFLVLNHPAFRVPKGSSWGWSDSEPFDKAPARKARLVPWERQGRQYRRIDQYLSESKVKIQMHPGDKPDEHTVTFHRPLQFYFKALGKAGFAVTRLEEWESHKKSEPGPRAKEENHIRKEIPMFLMLECQKVV